MHEVVSAETRLRTQRRLSHVYIMDVPAYPRPLLAFERTGYLQHKYAR